MHHYNNDLFLHSARRATELVIANEWSRRERVLVCILEGDKESLSLQTSYDSERIKRLKADSLAVYDDLNKANVRLHGMHDDLQRQNRKLAGLHQELERQEFAAPDRQKTLSENHGLTQRLKSLQAELNTLRLQQHENSEILTQKLALERQLSSLEMELSIAQDALRNSKVTIAQNDHESYTHLHVDEIAQQLFQETQRRQQLEKRMIESKDYHDSRSKVLESKLEALKAKLSGTRTELKQTQAQLLEARRMGSSSLDPEALQNHRRAKRGLIEQHDESEPNAANVSYLANNSNYVSTRLGEKSSFSLTPILQKTGNIVAGAGDSVVNEMEPQKNLVRPVAAVSMRHTLMQDFREISEDSEPHKVPRILGEGTRKFEGSDKPSHLTCDPKDGEHDESVQDLNPMMGIIKQQSIVQRKEGSSRSLKPKKVHIEVNESDILRKRRKLPGGQSHLFSEDDDEEGLLRDVRIAPGTRALGIGNISSLKPSSGQAVVNRRDQSRAAFSPLKRQKRAILARS